jgi:hypothetical protein
MRVGGGCGVGEFEEPRMAATTNLEQRIRELAVELSREFGQVEEQDGECLMTQVEDFAAQIGDALAARIMEQELAARESEEDRDCPCCQKPGYLKRRRKRGVQTKRGAIEIAEPEFYCGRCRKSFFPGVEETGDDA